MVPARSKVGAPVAGAGDNGERSGGTTGDLCPAAAPLPSCRVLVRCPTTLYNTLGTMLNNMWR